MTIFGWDMSHYDAPQLGRAVAEGIAFVTHKAGGDANDQELNDWWAGVRKAGPSLLLGAYWVLFPGSPRTRAGKFLDVLDSQCPGWRDRDAFILQVDCEKWNGDAGTVPGLADIRAFCDQLKQRTGLVPIVYAPKWVYGNSLRGLGYPLWASSYVSGSGGFKALYPGDGSSKWAAYSGQVPAILQYSSSATIGGQGTSDANAYRGTLAQLKALVAPQKENDMAEVDLTQAAADKVATAVVSKVLGSSGPNLGQDVESLEALPARLTEILNAVQAVSAPTVDVEALADAIVARLPQGMSLTKQDLVDVLNTATFTA
jgi:GH25 family lysozyme M1 (1,4-beta-N-acetylmuramidase)